MSKICKKCNIIKDLNDFYKHKAVCKTCHNQVSKLYRDNNPDVVKRNHRDSYLRDKERLKPIKSQYLRNKRLTNHIFAISDSFRRNLRTSFLRSGFSKSSKTQEILGCSFEEFKIYLESKFEPWMNWGNRGKYDGSFNTGWDIDHIIPVSSAKSEDDIIKLNHYTNLQPLCSKINRDIKKDLEIF